MGGRTLKASGGGRLRLPAPTLPKEVRALVASPLAGETLRVLLPLARGPVRSAWRPPPPRDAPLGSALFVRASPLRRAGPRREQRTPGSRPARAGRGGARGPARGQGQRSGAGAGAGAALRDPAQVRAAQVGAEGRAPCAAAEDDVRARVTDEAAPARAGRSGNRPRRRQGRASPATVVRRTPPPPRGPGLGVGGTVSAAAPRAASYHAPRGPRGAAVSASRRRLGRRRPSAGGVARAPPAGATSRLPPRPWPRPGPDVGVAGTPGTARPSCARTSSTCRAD